MIGYSEWVKKLIYNNFEIFTALAIFLIVSIYSANNVGIVGEVTGGWGLPDGAAVTVDYDQSIPVVSPNHTIGPLVASETRPLESLNIGDISIPLAVNQYTGGPPDWPARVVYWLTGSLTAVTGLHILLGGLLLLLTTRFLTFHASKLSAGLAGLALATSWSFIYYKKVLGGTEILLQAAGVLFVWALWSRRHSGGKHGATAVAVAVGLGLMAKITFAPVIAALCLAAVLTRWDHQPLKPPPKLRLLRIFGIVTLITSPLTIAFIHHEFFAPEHVVISHDFLDLQINRAFGGLTTAPREGAENLLWFALDPIQWFGPAYSAEVPNFLPLGRGFGWLLIIVGCFAAWGDRGSMKSGALLRFMSLAVPLEICALYLSNRDLHHLAQLVPHVAILLALSIERCAAMFTAPRSPRRALLALLLIYPWLHSGVASLRVTDRTISTSPIHTFTASGQSDLVELVERNGVERLWASDYDLYGALDMLLPSVEINNAWGDISHRRGTHREGGISVKVCNIQGHDCSRAALQDLLRSARGGHYLTVRPSAPMIYNLKPNMHALQHAAGAVGVNLEIVDHLEDDTGRWAELIRIF